MKRFLPLLILALAGFVPGASAQGGYSDHADRAEAAVFGDLFRLNDAKINFGGLGARLGVNANDYIQIEGEVAYDFRRAFTETFTNGTGAAAVVNSNVRVLHFMVGPKLQTNKGPVRLFVTAKGGFLNFMFNTRPATFATFGSSVQNLRLSNVNATFYPGAGAEAFWGPIGLRADIGDEIYFNHSAHNNLRLAVGPTIRF